MKGHVLKMSLLPLAAVAAMAEGPPSIDAQVAIATVPARVRTSTPVSTTVSTAVSARNANLQVQTIAARNTVDSAVARLPRTAAISTTVGLGTTSLEALVGQDGEEIRTSPPAATFPETGSFAPQFAAPHPAPGAGQAIARQRSAASALRNEGDAYVSQISLNDARTYFDRVGLASKQIDQDVVGEFDFSQVERFSSPDHLEIVDSSNGQGELVARSMKRSAAETVGADRSVAEDITEIQKDKSPASRANSTGALAENEVSPPRE